MCTEHVVMGFSILARGWTGINWNKIKRIVGAWFLSPVLAGVFTLLLYYPIRKYIVTSQEEIKTTLLAFPVLFGFTAMFDLATILTTGNVIYDLVSCVQDGDSSRDLTTAYSTLLF